MTIRGDAARPSPIKSRFLDLLLAPPTGLEASGARVSQRVLVYVRWVAVIGQAASLLVVYFSLGFRLPIGLAAACVAASVLVNLGTQFDRPRVSQLGDRAAFWYLVYDVLQLGALLFLTGGLKNPFAILMLAPITVAATILSRQSVLSLAALGIATYSVLAFHHLPLPWDGPPPEFPVAYVAGIWVALCVSTVFVALYTWNVAGGARRMSEAFAETQLALAREQRVSAVGALAAAAAHELGSPLGTIAVIAKELTRDLPPGSPQAEDAALLLSQSERCRTILAELARRPDSDGGSPYAVLPVSALVEAAGAPYRSETVRVIYATATSADGAGPGGGGPLAEEPLVKRSPEILHGLGNLIQNAIQFAAHEVTVTSFWDARTVSVDVTDDGEGFPAQVLDRVGEPYISGRADGTGHMGLGIFIARTLLERSGAELTFDNLPEGGGHVAIIWNRANLEAQDDARLT